MRQTAFLAVFFAAAVALPAADPVLLGLAMPDAKLAAGINVQKAKTSPLGQHMLSTFPTQDAGFQKFVAESGFDPRTDLQEMLMASTGTEHTGLVMARGTFNVAKIEAAATADGKHQVSTYNGAQLITGTNAKEQVQAIAFLTDVTPNIAIMGDVASVKAAIDRRKSPTALDPALAGKIAEYGASDAWSVSVLPVSNLGPLGNMGQVEFLKSVQQASGGVTLSSNVQFNAEAVADSTQNAAALGDVIKFLVSMATAQAGKDGNTAIPSFINSLQVTTQGSTVKISLSIPESDVETLIKAAHGNEKGHARI